MNCFPQISVVVPAHEVEPGILLKSLSSLAKQSLAAREYEVVVFDDGSRDSTPQVIQDFIQDKPQFRYFRHERCQGISATRNSAIQEARGSLIALVDADDYLEAKSLERALLFHRKNPDVLYSYSRHIRVNSSGEVLYKVDSRPFDPELLLHINFVAHLKCFSRELHLKIGGYDTAIKYAEDWDHALRASEKLGPGQFMHNPEYLYNYVIHDKNSIHRPKEELDAWRVKVITAALQRRGITANPKVSHQTEDRYNYVAW